MNGISINSAEDFKKLYQDDPGLAIGLLFENVGDLRKQCSCRLETCREDFDKKLSQNKLKNLAAQAGGGFVGGLIAIGIKMGLLDG